MSNYGIEMSLKQLASLAWQSRLDPRICRLALPLTEAKTGRRAKMEALVAELHRRFVLAPGPTNSEAINGQFEDGNTLDADDACVFVAAAAMSVGIPCRIIGARYGQFWTCFVSYEDDPAPTASCVASSPRRAPRWETIDPLRQKKPDREPDETVVVNVQKQEE